MPLGVYGGLNASQVYGDTNAQKCMMAAMLLKNIYKYVFFQNEFFLSIFSQSVFLRSVPDLRVFFNFASLF